MDIFHRKALVIEGILARLNKIRWGGIPGEVLEYPADSIYWDMANEYYISRRLFNMCVEVAWHKDNVGTKHWWRYDTTTFYVVRAGKSRTEALMEESHLIEESNLIEKSHSLPISLDDIKTKEVGGDINEQQ